LVAEPWAPHGFRGATSNIDALAATLSASASPSGVAAAASPIIVCDLFAIDNNSYDTVDITVRSTTQLWSSAA